MSNPIERRNQPNVVIKYNKLQIKCYFIPIFNVYIYIGYHITRID